ncbi:2OG-Fe dioxygenase family protein, partial [Acinetobacter baumannii]
ARITSAFKGERPWFIEAHPFRIDTSDGIGRPTPEGAHRDGVDLEQGYLRSVSIVTLFGWPFHGLISCYAIEVIDLLFGRQ